jgi:TonB-dependent receptor
MNLTKCACYSFVGLVFQSLLITLLFCAPSESQNLRDVKVTIGEGELTLERSFRLIEQQTPFRFTYDVAEIPLTAEISQNIKSGVLYDVLKHLATAYGLSFTVLDNQIVVKKSLGSSTADAVIESSSVRGKVTDAQTGEALASANIYLVGTTIGAASKLNGEYEIVGIPQGRYTVRATFIGYKQKDSVIQVRPGQTLIINIKMEPAEIVGREVVITAQLRGQNAAISQQINSNSIINVLSKERIQELPDQNAAETISRLPGISIQRSGGEGQKVIIRGLDPKYTQVTVNGVKIPSLDEEDRSIDLSSISAEMLEGIEVLKSYTADQDGDAVGGTVNFTMKKAPDALSAQVRMQGGYNNLQKDYGDHKATVSVSDRFFGGALGLIATGNIERSNRSSHQLNANYITPRPFTVAPDLKYTVDIRKRYGASLEADVKINEEFNIYLSAFGSYLLHNPIQQDKSFSPSTGNVGVFQYTDGEITNKVGVLSLAGDNKLSLPLIGLLNVGWGVSGTQTEQNKPFVLSARFYQTGINGLNYNSGPDMLFSTWQINPDTMYGNQMKSDSSKVLDKNVTYRLDASNDFTFGSEIFGHLKFGGKFNHKSRERGFSELLADNQMGIIAERNYYRSHPTLDNPFAPYRLLASGTLAMSNFLSGEVENFLGGRFAGWPTLGGDALHAFYDKFKTYNRVGRMFSVQKSATSQAYTAGEDITAGYIEAQINIGQEFTVLGGLRYEKTSNDFKSIFGRIEIDEDQVPTFSGAKDTVGTTSYDEWLPTMNVKYTPLKGTILRASASKTLSRPNFFDLVPYQSFSNILVKQGNPALKHVTSHNYDVGMSVHNEYGFLSLGGFYKTLDNVMYTATRFINAGNPRTNPYYGLYLYQKVNASDPSNVYGVEFELQANFLMLPSPFNGLILNGNMAFMKSKTIVPFINIDNPQDTTRTVSMPGQTNEIANLTVGYEKGDFSGRISLIYQGKSLFAVGLASDLDSYTAPYYRWDLSLQQKLFSGVSVFFNVYNCTNVKDQSFLGVEGLPTSLQEYGLVASLGIQYRMR